MPAPRIDPIASVAVLVTAIVFTPGVAIPAASVVPSVVLSAAALLVGPAAATRIAAFRPDAARETDETERQQNDRDPVG